MKPVKPLPSIEEILRKDQEFKLRIERAIEADAQARLSLLLRAPFPVEERVSQSVWMSGPSRDELHVWLHVTDDGDPFFVGRGRGATAWTRNGGLAWEWFVREELGGSYHVVIPARGLDEQGSQALVDAVMSKHWDKLLNQYNAYRPSGRDMDRRWELQAKVKPFYDAVRDADSDERRVVLSSEALRLQYEATSIQAEEGRFGEVLRKMGADRATNVFFIKPLIESLMRLGRVDVARQELKKFKEMSPGDSTRPTVVKLQAIVDRGTYRKRGKAV